MKKTVFKTMMGVGLSGMMMTGCVENIEDLYDPNYVIQQYQRNWEDAMGEIDPDQTWNTAKRVVADLHLNNQTSRVEIYTANPLTPTTKLLGTATITGQGSFEFDMPKALNYVYVKVLNAPTLNGYYSVQDGLVTVAPNLTRAGESVASLGEKIPTGIFGNPVNGWAQEAYPGEIYYLNNVPKTNASQWRYLDYQPLFGKEGYFAEGASNYELYSEKWDVNKDIVYTTAEEGPVEISYSFGSTRKKNMFGYFYFKEGATIDEILNTPKYILMTDARPTSNITMSDFSNGFDYLEDMNMGDWLQNNMLPDGSFQGGDPFVTGSTYKLTYFGEDGMSEGSEIFPVGVNIGFFVITDGMESTADQLIFKIWYSMPSLNYRTAKVHEAQNVYEPDVIAVSYKYGDTQILGFEDNIWGDKDMNDIVFFVAGEFKEDYTPEQEFPVVPPTVDSQEWILACEDLGNTDDFDFNDIVFSVKHSAGSNAAFVTPLAAGGTMPATICYNGQPIGQEIHEWFGTSTSTMVNTTNRKKHVAKTVEITVNDNFTMTSNMGGFTIEVNNGTTVVAAPSAGAAPQMILVSNPNWSWPYERTSIVDAYEGFQEWAADASKNQDWYNIPTGNTIDGDFTNSTPEKDEETETTTPDDEKKEEGGEDGSTSTTPDNEEKKEDDNEKVSGDATNNTIVVDMDAVKANGNVIPASYFTSSNKVDIIITVSNTAYIQFGEYGNYVGNYFSDSYTFTITDQTNLLKIQEKGLSFAQGIESIASITIINY